MDSGLLSEETPSSSRNERKSVELNRLFKMIPDHGDSHSSSSQSSSHLVYDPMPNNNPMGAADAFVPYIETPQLFTAVARSKVMNRKRNRLIGTHNTLEGNDNHGGNIDINDNGSVDHHLQMPSSSSSSSSAQDEQYKLQHFAEGTDDTGGSSDEDDDADGSDNNKKSKKARTIVKGQEEREIIRRNQSPACRYELVRIALIRFREVRAGATKKRENNTVLLSY